MRDLRVLGLKTGEGGHMHVTARCGPALVQLVGMVDPVLAAGGAYHWQWSVATVAQPAATLKDGECATFNDAVEALGNALARWGEP